MAEHPEDIGSDAVYARMRYTDVYVPRAYVREEWGRRRKEQDYIDIIQRMADENFVPIGWMRKTSLDYKEKYIWKVGITGIDASTKRPVERTVTVESNENENIGSILDAGWGWAAQYGLDLYATPPTVQIVEAIRTP